MKPRRCRLIFSPRSNARSVPRAWPFRAPPCGRRPSAFPSWPSIHDGLMNAAALEVPPGRLTQRWTGRARSSSCFAAVFRWWDRRPRRRSRNRPGLPRMKPASRSSISSPRASSCAGCFSGGGGLEWCDRRLLARIHRYTLHRLRAEIEPVSRADFQRFLFVWHSVATGTICRASTGFGRFCPCSTASSCPRPRGSVRCFRRGSIGTTSVARHAVPDGRHRLGAAQPCRAAGGPGRSHDATRLACAFLREHADAWHTLRLADEST